MNRKSTAFCLLFLFFLFSGCETISPNTAGQIIDKGIAGETTVVGVGNSETPASLDRQENTFQINHQDGDELVIEGRGPRAPIEEISRLINGSPSELTVNDTQQMSDPNSFVETETFEDWKVTYHPKAGAVTQLTGVNVKAATGNSRVDIAAQTRELMKNTKTIQYVGIGFLIAAAAWGFIFKTPFQAMVIGGVGVGLIILQATLANPIWSWVMVFLVLGLPAFWIYHYLTRKKEGETLEKIIPKIDEFATKYPQHGEELLNLFGRSMSDIHKKIIKKKKEQLKIP